MAELFAHLARLLEGSLLGPILLVAAIAGGTAHHFAAADLESAAGRQRVRVALEAGGRWRRLYVWLLTRGLNRLDRFLGDADKAASSLPSPFRNREAWPYWTGWSFDRCALLALIYPLLSLFVVWAWTGEGGTIGALLGLKSGASWWSRYSAAGLTAAMIFALWRGMPIEGWRSALWVAVAVALAVAGTVADAGAFVVAGAVAVAVAGAVAVAVTSAVIWAVRRNRLGMFWTAYWPIALAAWYLGLLGAAWAGTTAAGLGMMLMFALVPLINVPFDWASLGLTRALLRRGCEPDAPSPLWLGLLDFAFGLVLLVLLAIALIAGLQMADAIILRLGGGPLANVVALLDNIAEQPRNPGNYWAYFTLFSTLIPSALNAVIGAVSLIGWWWRPARDWVLIQLSALDRADDKGIRVRVAALLGLQVGLGAALTCLVLWGLWEALLEMPYALPLVVDLLKGFALALA